MNNFGSYDGRVTKKVTKLQIWSELVILAVVGCVVVAKSAWCDPDPVLEVYWYPLLLGLGLAFGFLGRAPVWAIGPTTGLVVFYAMVHEAAFWGLESAMFQLLMFVVLAGLVSFGAVIGRSVGQRARCLHQSMER